MILYINKDFDWLIGNLGIYRKIPIIAYICSKGFFGGLFWWAFRLSLFFEGLIIQRNLAFQNGLGSTIKTA